MRKNARRSLFSFLHFLRWHSISSLPMLIILWCILRIRYTCTDFICMFEQAKPTAVGPALLCDTFGKLSRWFMKIRSIRSTTVIRRSSSRRCCGTQKTKIAKTSIFSFETISIKDKITDKSQSQKHLFSSYLSTLSSAINTSQVCLSHRFTFTFSLI